MRKLAAILFLGLLLFNLAGYRLWFYYAQHKAEQQLLAALDNERYNTDDLLELRVPLSLPYQTDWSEFERVNGEIEIEGKVFKYVKRKVVNGELVLYCLPDASRAKIETARETFFKLANSLQSEPGAKKQNTHNNLSLKNILSDYDQAQQGWLLQPLANGLPVYSITQGGHLHSILTETPDQPPEVGQA